MDFKYWITFLPAICLMQAFSQSQITAKNVSVLQLTHDASGHTIHNTECFSPDDQWIVYDGRNYDSLISSTGNISMVKIKTGEIRELYHTTHQTSYGPGVGAATFSPTAKRVIFIHGIRNSDKNNPYDFTRRTGMAIDVAKPFHPIFMDARDITPPFTPGALRGGTHAHNWSADGEWVSFTYNDYIMQQLEKTDASLKDLRTVGVMVPGHPVYVAEDSLQENNSGKMFAVVVAEVTENPKPGSDEIDRAFDEGWIGSKGYRKNNGKWQRRAIAFQGEVVNSDGSRKTEVFVADLPGDVTKATPGKPLEGTTTSRPNVPAGVRQRRITYTSNGVQGPRHWLRTTRDGSLIAFLTKDDEGIVQLFGVSPNGGNIRQFSFNDFSIQGPFNFSPDGKYVAYLADNSVFVTELSTGESQRLTPSVSNAQKVTGSVVWSNNGLMLAFNKYVKDKATGKLFLQIFVVKLNSAFKQK